MKNRKFLAGLLALILVCCFFTTTAAADKNENTETVKTEAAAVEETETAAEEPEEPEVQETDAEEPEIIEEDENSAEPVVVSEGETVYNNGEVVFNNGGTVYNNGGEVYNNAGIVYNNLGIVYNNGGTVYNNNGTVYANDGEIYTNGGEIINPKLIGDLVVEVSESADTYAVIAGLTVNDDGEVILDEEVGIITVEAKPGFELTLVDCDCGVVEEEDGVYTISEITESCVLTVEARVEAPVLSLESGTYAEKHKLTIETVEGAEIHYTLDGTDPDENSPVYKPMSISDSTVIKAVAVVDGAENSEIVVGEYAYVSITAPKFDSQEEKYEQPDEKGIVFQNKGDVDAVIESIEISGDAADSFVLSTEDGGTVEAGSTDDSTWTLCPVAGLKAGTYKATVVITFDSGETVELAVSFRVK